MKYPDIFNPDLSRIGTRDSQMYNLVAGELVTQVVRTALGPRGMSKVYIDILGEETVTSHGGAFLRKVDVDHPAAKTVVDAVNTVDNHVGDGTTTAAVLIGSLLRHAREMRGMRVPTAAIISGYEAAMDAALRCLADVRFGGDAGNRGTMRALARCCMAGRALGESVSDPGIAEMLVDAAYSTSELGRGRAFPDDVKIEEKAGNPSQTRLVYGTVIDKPVDSAAMPREVRGARVLLVNEPLERSRTKTESEVSITRPEQMHEFVQRESDDLGAVAGAVVDSGANVVISRKGIDESVQETLARHGIISIRRVKYNDIWWLEKSTGAVTCTNIGDIRSAELGHASRVYEDVIGGDRMLFVESDFHASRGVGVAANGGADGAGLRGAGHGSVTLLLRSNSKAHLDEFHRTALNVLYVLRDFVECPYLVYGGGSCEAVLASQVRSECGAIGGKAQVAAMRFADALEDIPMTLAENVGMRRLDALPRLRSLIHGDARPDHQYGTNRAGARLDHNSGHGDAKGESRESPANASALHGRKSGWYGIDSASRSVRDISALADPVLEPYVVKAQVIKSSVEAACAVLNVDDVFVKDLIDNTHCHIDGTVHAHKEPGRNHNHWEQEGLEQRQMHHYY